MHQHSSSSSSSRYAMICACFTFVRPSPSGGVGWLSLRRKCPQQVRRARERDGVFKLYYHYCSTDNFFHAPEHLEKYAYYCCECGATKRNARKFFEPMEGDGKTNIFMRGGGVVAVAKSQRDNFRGLLLRTLTLLVCCRCLLRRKRFRSPISARAF